MWNGSRLYDQMTHDDSREDELMKLNGSQWGSMEVNGRLCKSTGIALSMG